MVFNYSGGEEKHLAKGTYTYLDLAINISSLWYSISTSVILQNIMSPFHINELRPKNQSFKNSLL